jgi:alpha-galactosidase
MMPLVGRLVIILCLASLTMSLQNGAAQTPPMGFNDWNEIAAKYPPWSKGVNETDIRAVAQALVSTGLKDKGYVYVNLDCGYSNGTRDASGALIADKTKFPSGLKGLGAYIHSIGLKYGIYTSGSQCCAPKGSNDGLIGHEEEDAAQMAAIGIDYVKNDDCGSTDASFLKFRDALNKTGRPMVYSIHTSWTHGHKKGFGPADAVPVANIWRTTGDIRNDWADILNRAMLNDAYAHLAGPGQWNDPDMLEIGNKGVTDAEGRSHFALWYAVFILYSYCTHTLLYSCSTVLILYCTHTLVSGLQA